MRQVPGSNPGAGVTGEWLCVFSELRGPKDGLFYLAGRYSFCLDMF